MSSPCHLLHAHQRDAPPCSALLHDSASTRRKQTRCSQLCHGLKIFAPLFPPGRCHHPGQGCSHRDGTHTLGAGCSWHAVVRSFPLVYEECLGVVIISLNHPKRMLCPVFQKQNVPWNSIVAIVPSLRILRSTYSSCYWVWTLSFAFFKVSSTKVFLSASKIVYFSICQPQLVFMIVTKLVELAALQLSVEVLQIAHQSWPK